MILFLSAFGFFFSRLLLNWPFATSSSQVLCRNSQKRFRVLRYHLRFAGEPPEVGKHGLDELLSARILRRQRSSKEIEKIAGLLGSFLPICRRRGAFPTTASRSLATACPRASRSSSSSDAIWGERRWERRRRIGRSAGRRFHPALRPPALSPLSASGRADYGAGGACDVSQPCR